jgi:outer membrane protein OmpA-like peptidoglycan-associated protein
LKFIYLILITVFIAVFSPEITAQAPSDSYDDIEIMSNNDTLVITKSNGTWWYGVHGGADFNQAFGTLYPYPPTSDFNLELERGIEFGAASGLGWNTGIMAEWMKPGSFFGAILRISYDNWGLSGESTQQFNLDESEALANYSHFSDFSYFRISPSVRYNPWDNGFHLIGGLNVDIPIAERGIMESEAVNTGLLRDGLTFFYNSENSQTEDITGRYTLIETNYGLHFGLGWDYLLGDVFGAGRLKATPFAIASLNYGMAQGRLSEPFDDLESSLHLANLRVGLQIKFAQDNIQYDTLKYDPTYKPPVLIVEDVLADDGVNFSGFIKRKTIESADLSFIELPKVQEQLREDAIINVERPKDEPTDIAEVPQAPKFDVQMNVDKIFNYNSTNATAPTKNMRDYLDAVADYMRDNPNVRLSIEIHTDNTGSSAEKTRRGQTRGDRVKRYLVGKGVSERRLFDRNLRDTRPVTSNRTAAGRKQNRRLILRVAPARSDRR